MATIQYYYWLMSDWAYLGAERLTDIARRHGALVDHYPIRLPDVYAATGGVTLDKRSVQRQTYRIVELKRWRDHLAMPLNLEPRHFPVNVDLASQAIYAAKAGQQDPDAFSSTLLRAVWVEDRDISDPSVIENIAAAVGLDGAELVGAARQQGTRDAYEAATAMAPQVGVFGSPFYILDGETFWGQDRLEFLDEALARSST